MGLGKKNKPFPGQSPSDIQLEDVVANRLSAMEMIDSMIKKMLSNTHNFNRSAEAMFKNLHNFLVWYEKFGEAWCPDVFHSVQGDASCSMPIMRTKSPVTEREAVMVAASNHTEAPRPVSMNPTSLNFASEGNVPKNTPISESARVGAQPPPRPARVKSQPFRAQGAVKLPPRNLKHRTDMTNAQNGSNSSSTAWSNGLSKADSDDQDVYDGGPMSLPVRPGKPTPMGPRPGRARGGRGAPRAAVRKTMDARGLRPLDTKETEQRPQMQSLPSPKPAARSVSVRGRGVGPRVMSQPVIERPQRPAISPPAHSPHQGQVNNRTPAPSSSPSRPIPNPMQRSRSDLSQSSPNVSAQHASLHRPPPSRAKNRGTGNKSLRAVPNKALPPPPPGKKGPIDKVKDQLGPLSDRGSVRLVEEADIVKGDLGFARGFMSVKQYQEAFIAIAGEYHRGLGKEMDALTAFMRDTLKSLNSLRKTFDKARSDLVSHSKNLERERGKPQLDVIKLFQMEKEQTKLYAQYDRTLCELSMFVLDPLKIVELEKHLNSILRIRVSMGKKLKDQKRIAEAKVKEAREWQERERSTLRLKRQEREKKQREFQFTKIVDSYKDMVDLLTAEDGVFLHTLLEYMSHKSSQTKQIELETNIRQIFYSHKKPIPEWFFGPNEHPEWSAADLVKRGIWNSIDVFLRGHYDNIVRYLAGTNLYPDIVVTYSNALSQLQGVIPTADPCALVFKK